MHSLLIVAYFSHAASIFFIIIYLFYASYLLVFIVDG